MEYASFSVHGMYVNTLEYRGAGHIRCSLSLYLYNPNHTLHSHSRYSFSPLYVGFYFPSQQLLKKKSKKAQDNRTAQSLLRFYKNIVPH